MPRRLSPPSLPSWVWSPAEARAPRRAAYPSRTSTRIRWRCFPRRRWSWRGSTRAAIYTNAAVGGDLGVPDRLAGAPRRRGGLPALARRRPGGGRRRTRRATWTWPRSLSGRFDVDRDRAATKTGSGRPSSPECTPDCRDVHRRSRSPGPRSPRRPSSPARPTACRDVLDRAAKSKLDRWEPPWVVETLQTAAAADRGRRRLRDPAHRCRRPSAPSPCPG